jgi:hypothetical protein
LARFFVEICLSRGGVEISFMVLFFSVFFICFGMQAPLLAQPWESWGEVGSWRRIENLVDVLVLLMIVGLSCFPLFQTIFRCPVPCLLFLYSFWLPQIFHSLVDNSMNRDLILFAVLLTISRGFPLIYFALYKKNIMSSYGLVTGIGFTLYLGMQLAAVICQSLLGGKCLLPRRFRGNDLGYTV